MTRTNEDLELKAALEGLVPEVSASGKWARVGEKRGRPGRSWRGLEVATAAVGIGLIVAIGYWGITSVPSDDLLVIDDRDVDDGGVVYALDQVDGITVFRNTTPDEHIPVPRRAFSLRLYFVGKDLYVEGVENLSFSAGSEDDDLEEGLLTRSGTLGTSRSPDASGAYEATFQYPTGRRVTFRVVPEEGQDYAALLPVGEDRAGNILVVLWGGSDESVRSFLAIGGNGSIQGRATVRLDGDYGGRGIKATETAIYELRNSSSDGVQVIRHELRAAK